METVKFEPLKSLWTQDDFEQMCWHDCRLHGICQVDDFHPHEHEVRFDTIGSKTCQYRGAGRMDMGNLP